MLRCLTVFTVLHNLENNLKTDEEDKQLRNVCNSMSKTSQDTHIVQVHTHQDTHQTQLNEQANLY